MELMHRYTDETEALSRAIVAYARNRIASPQPLDGSASSEELGRRAGDTITPQGLGGEEALRIWAEVLAPATISTDHPSSMAFVPSAPTKASVLFDLVVGASSTIAAGWIDGAGAIWAENQALRWVADLAGFPETAGGVFVSGGSAGNLSALVAARAAARARLGQRSPHGWKVALAESAHSSIVTATRVMDVEVLRVDGDERGRLTGPALEAAIDALPADEATGVFAVVASAGATNAGTIDDLAGVADVCATRSLWMHVDGAYGGAGLAAPAVRRLYDGIERADSFIVDPHKWLFAPYDCCALLYRDPGRARGVFRQEASYLDTVNQDDAAWSEWNPADYAYHLTRRARGLPFWFSLATYGTDAYREAVGRVLSLTREVADEIRRRDGLELVVEPDLSVILFRRLGWSEADYESWWRRILEAQIAFVQPTSWHGEKVARLCFVNPRTTLDHVRAVLGTMDWSRRPANGAL
jgi:glutamate/tyrosine decarboxylase-like PLP-dependent enzyme